MSDSVNPHGSSPSEQVVGFRAMYDAGPPPWDIGRPQPAFLELAEQGVLAGRVLDVGCGTGEHALMAAARGLDATGIDAVPRAITLAQRKARDRGLAARFLVWDALRLPDLGEEFDTVVDSGLFHVFDDEDRRRFVASLHASHANRLSLPSALLQRSAARHLRSPSSAPVGDQRGVRVTGLASRCHRCCDDGHQYGCHRRKRLARQRHPRLSASRTLLGCSAGDVAADLLVACGGWWTAVAAGGGASGWVLGGLITEYAGWRWVFAINVPIGLAALVVGPLVLPADRKQAEHRRLDLGGALTAAAGLALLVYGLTSAGERGLDGLATWLPLVLAAVAFVIFVRHEGRTTDPLVPLGLLRSPPVAAANLTALAITASTTPAAYLSVLYIQDVLGVPAGRASLLFPAINLAVIVGSLAGPTSAWTAGRSAHPTGWSSAASLSGSRCWWRLPAGGLPVIQLLAAFVLIGAGIGTASVASTQTGTDAADPAYRGVTAGVLNSAAQVGTAVGVALLVPLATAAIGSALMAGYRSGFWAPS